MQAQTVCWGGDTKEWPDKPDFEPKDFVDALKISMTKYCRFVGRASRAEFWMFFTWQLIIAAIALHTTGNVVMLAFVVGVVGAAFARRGVFALDAVPDAGAVGRRRRVVGYGGVRADAGPEPFRPATG